MSNNAKSIKHVVVWFRRDLRIRDNPSLVRAADIVKKNKGCTVSCAVCLDPREVTAITPHGNPKTGVHRLRFMLESISDLRNNLRGLGSDLHVSAGNPEDVIPSLIAKAGVASGACEVIYQSEITSEEVSIERKLKKKLAKDTVVYSHYSYNMLDPQDLPMPVRSMPDMFTSWRKKVESADVQPRSVVDAPEVGAMPLPSAWDAGLKELPSETDLFNDLVATYKSKANVDGEPPRNKNHSIGIDLVMPEIALEKGVMRFEGGETAGLDRIEDYIFRQDCLKNYYDTRNGLMGANYSSKFSPWLAMGCISARQIHVACQKYERMRVKNKSTYWMIFELLWRDFFHLYFMKHGSKPFMLKGVFPRPNVEWDEGAEKLAMWKEGRTGHPLVDANMREMVKTGWMGNRGRQIVASFIIHDMGMDWRLGADFMESMLIDYDPCSNWGNWHALAGLNGGTIHRFNVLKQAKTYDPDGRYVQHWIPELSQLPGKSCIEPYKAGLSDLREAGVVLGETYPRPIKTHPWGPKYGVSHVTSGKSNGRKTSGVRNRDRKDSNRRKQRSIDSYFSTSIGNKE